MVEIDIEEDVRDHYFMYVAKYGDFVLKNVSIVQNHREYPISVIIKDKLWIIDRYSSMMFSEKTSVTFKPSRGYRSVSVGAE